MENLDNLNHQTKEKILAVKELIKENVPLKDIIKSKFTTKNKKTAWLDKNNMYFSSSELEYLEYIEVLQVEEIDYPEEEKQNNKELAVPSFFNTNLAKLSDKEKTSLLLDNRTLFIIQQMAKDYMDNQSNQSKPLDIDNKYFKLKDITVKNCRISNQIYNDFTNYAKSKDITITVLLNYVLDTFIKSHK